MMLFNQLTQELVARSWKFLWTRLSQCITAEGGVFAQNELDSLSESIERNGSRPYLFGPKKGFGYELIAENVVYGLGLLGLKTVSCIINDCDERQSLLPPQKAVNPDAVNFPA